ncbi:MAG TPA: PilN domain-containing protein [Thermodesulfovibrionales bacterium]|nr:PilN domain-containing protein [Thermodesulfovibrionales bacterium]
MNSTLVINKLTTFVSSSSAAARKLADPVWRFLTFSLADDAIYPARALCATIEKDAMSVAYGTRILSKTTIKGARDYPFEEGKYPQPDVFASSLSLAINDFGAGKAGITLSIPKAWAVIKTAEFPLAVKENLSSVVAYELDRITPFSSDDAFFDFRVVDEKEDKLVLLVIAAKADMVRPYIEALSEKGIGVGRISVNISGIETVFRFADKKAESIFLEIRKDSYEGALFMNGLIGGAFSGSFGSADDTSKLNTLAKEIGPLADTLKINEKPAVLNLILRDKNHVLKEMLKSGLPCTVRILNETAMNIRVPGYTNELPYAAVGGVLESIWPKANSLNLLDKGVHERAKPPLALTALLALSIVVMWILYLIAPLKIEEKRLQEIDHQISIRKDEIKKVEALKKEIDAIQADISTINDFKHGRPMALNILKELTTILPKSTWLSRLRITETTVELEGYAASASGLLSKLEASSYFKKAEFASPTFRDVRMNSDRFNIKMEIEGFTKTNQEKKAGENDEE